MKKIGFFATVLFFISCYSFSQTNNLQQGVKLFQDSNYKDAYSVLYQVALTSSNDKDVVVAVEHGVNSLKQLGLTYKCDVFLKKVINKHKSSARILRKVGLIYTYDLPHYGYIVAGKFKRGNSRGQGKYVNCTERDRVQSLICFKNAMENLSDYSSKEKGQFYFDFANIVFNTSNFYNAWKLQLKTDLKKIPDFETSIYSSYSSRFAPVKNNGEPIFIETPTSFESAKNDGERWFWLLKKVYVEDNDRKPEILFIKADFFKSQFGVNTIEYSLRKKVGRIEKGEFALTTLKDDETICQLANGIKRIKLKDDYNFILIFKQLAGLEGGFAEKSLDNLSEIYKNRRQYEKAAFYIKKGIEVFGKGQGNIREKQLNQIIGNFGIFQPTNEKVKGLENYLTYRFRNGKKVTISIFEVDVEKLIKDVKNYIKLNSTDRFYDYSFVSFSNIANQIVNENREKYKKDKVASFQVKLNPAKNHFDKETTIKLPNLNSGCYFVVGKMENGNTSYIGFNVFENVLFGKKFDKAMKYFVVNGKTGLPVKNCKVRFFGYKKQYENGYFRGRRKSKIITKEFDLITDNNGSVLLQDKDYSSYTWIIYPTNLKQRYFLKGLERFWYSNYNDYFEKTYKTFVVTDRPAYKPRDTVFVKAYIAKPDYVANSNTVLKNQPIILKVRDGKYKVVFEKNLKTDEFGSVSYSFSIDKTANLGKWSIVVSSNLKDIKLSRGYVNFNVEEYEKPEFEVLVDAPSTKMLGEKITVKISSKYYFGKPVTHGKLHYKVFRQTVSHNPYPICPWDWLYGNGYLFKTTTFNKSYFRRFENFAPRELVMDNIVDIGENGVTLITIDTSFAKEVFGDKNHKYTITAEVTDNSRRKIFSSKSFTVSHKPFFVYLQSDKNLYFTNSSVKIKVNALSGNNMPVTLGNVSLTLYKVTNEKEQVVLKRNGKLNSSGNSEFLLKATDKGYYKVVCNVKSKGKTVNSELFFRVLGKGDGDSSFVLNDLELIPEKNYYKPGETVNFHIGTNDKKSFVYLFVRPLNGVYLNCNGVLIKNKATNFQVAVTDKDYPNFFVEALVIKNGNIYTILKEIFVPPVEKVLNIDINLEKSVFLPGEIVSGKIKVRDKNKEPVETCLTLSVYDFALNYISKGSNIKDINSFFWKFKRNHSPSTTSSVYNVNYNVTKHNEETLRPIGIFGFIVEDSSTDDYASGGDTTKMYKTTGMVREAAPSPTSPMLNQSVSSDKSNETTNSQIRENFADSAYFNGHLVTNKKGEAFFKFKLPDNLTTWKLNCLTVADGTKVGSDSKKIKTFKPLLIRLQKPRFLTEGDKTVISVNVHNYLNKQISAKVSLSKKGNCLKLAGSTEKTITLNPNEEIRLDFEANATGEGQVLLIAKAVSNNFADGIKAQIPVFVHGVEKTVSVSRLIPKDKTVTEFEITIPKNRKPNTTGLQINISPSLAASMLDALPYLADYPYGCTEQTINRFVPAIITAQVLTKLNVNLGSLKEGNNLNSQEIGNSAIRKEQWNKLNRFVNENNLKDMVKMGLHKLKNMQNPDGGFSWFYSYGFNSYPDTTVIVVRGLLKAKSLGYNVDNEMLEKGLSYLKKYRKRQIKLIENSLIKRKPFKNFADNLDSYINYVLADAGYVSEDMDRFLLRDKNKLSLYGKILLALTMNREEKFKERDRLIYNVEQFLEIDSENQTAYLRVEGNLYNYCWYGNEIETNAWYLKLLAFSKPNDIKAAMLVKYLLNNRKHSSYWYSTRDTAYCLEAFGDYLLKTKEFEPNVSIEIQFDGKTVYMQNVTKSNLFTFNNVLKLNEDLLISGKHKVKIIKKGSSPLYVNSYLTYFSLEKFIKSAGLEVKVKRKYYKLVNVKSVKVVANKNNNPYEQSENKYKRVEIENFDSIKSGDLVEVEFVLESKNDYEYIVLEDLKPAGFEPVSVNSGYDGNSLGAYIEYRSRKVVMFIRSLNRGTSSVSYTCYALTPGEYSALPAKVSGMYAPELTGNSNEFKVGVND